MHYGIFRGMYTNTQDIRLISVKIFIFMICIVISFILGSLNYVYGNEKNKNPSFYTQKDLNFFSTKLTGTVILVKDDEFAIDTGFGKFSIQFKENIYQPKNGDDVTVVGQTNEFYAKQATIFADKILLHGRKFKSDISITRNITDGWVSISGRVSSILNNVMHLYADDKIIINLHGVAFIPPLQVGSLVSINGYLLNETNGNIIINANNIIKISN